MRPRSAALLFLVVPALALADKPPWLWTDFERLARRFAKGAIEQRSGVPSPDRYGAVLDFVDGSRDPGMLLPNEVFVHLIRAGFPRSGKPQQWASKALERAGTIYLIPDLEPILKRRAQVVHQLPANATNDDQCRALFEAFASVRAELGSRYGEFLRFLYVEVAPGMKVERWSSAGDWEAGVRREATGCRAQR